MDDETSIHSFPLLHLYIYIYILPILATVAIPTTNHSSKRNDFILRGLMLSIHVRTLWK
jgi:hypothetical protein